MKGGIAGVAAIGATLILLAQLDADVRAVVTPLLALYAGAVLFAAVVWRREGALPLFEIGTLFMLALLAYSSVPLLVHLLSGGVYTVFNPMQMFVLAPTHQQVAVVAWFYVLFMVVFGAVYIAARGSRRVPVGTPIAVGNRELTAVFVIFVGSTAAVLLIFAVTGADFNSAYDPDAIASAAAAYSNMSLFARQLLHNLFGVTFFAKIALFVYLVSNWRRASRRWLLVGWTILIVAQYLMKMGARTEIMLTFVALALLLFTLLAPRMRRGPGGSAAVTEDPGPSSPAPTDPDEVRTAEVEAVPSSDR